MGDVSSSTIAASCCSIGKNDVASKSFEMHGLDSVAYFI